MHIYMLNESQQKPKQKRQHGTHMKKTGWKMRAYVDDSVACEVSTRHQYRQVPLSLPCSPVQARRNVGRFPYHLAIHGFSQLFYFLLQKVICSPHPVLCVLYLINSCCCCNPLLLCRAVVELCSTIYTYTKHCAAY